MNFQGAEAQRELQRVKQAHAEDLEQQRAEAELARKALEEQHHAIKQEQARAHAEAIARERDQHASALEEEQKKTQSAEARAAQAHAEKEAAQRAVVNSVEGTDDGDVAEEQDRESGPGLEPETEVEQE